MHVIFFKRQFIIMRCSKLQMDFNDFQIMNSVINVLSRSSKYDELVCSSNVISLRYITISVFQF